MSWEREDLHIWLMPWSGFVKPLEFGEITIWDFYKEAPARVENRQELLALAQFMTLFKAWQGHDLRNVGIIQNGSVPFAPQSPEGNAKIRWASKAICFSHICEHVKHLAKDPNVRALRPSSERFQAMGMLLSENGEIIYNRPGIYGAANLDSVSLSFREPAVMGSKTVAVDRLLMKGLAKLNDMQQLNDQQQGTPLWNMLEVCFEWFYNAWSNSEEISGPGRFIALMTAFEALIKVKKTYDPAPKQSVRAAELCGWNSLPITETIRINNRQVAVSKPTKFITQFAEYRNEFVHGSKLPWGWIRHRVGDKAFLPIEVMTSILHIVVSKLLLKENLYDDEWEIPIMENHISKIISGYLWDSENPIGPSLPDDDDDDDDDDGAASHKDGHSASHKDGQ